jgi:autotransporter strand-loop-strand O-heptosyltransferase
MRILYVPSHLSTGGMPQFVLKRLQSMKNHTNNEYYVVEYQCHSLDYVVQRNAIKSLLLENFTTLYEDKMQLFDVIERFQPDIIHIDEMSERLDREMVKKLYNPERKYRIVETCHDISFDPNSKLFHPDLYSFCTPYHEQTFAELESKYVTILYPIEEMKLKKFQSIWQDELGFDKNKKHVLNVGLWTPGKNQAEGIEIARKYPDMMFHFVGNQAGNFKHYWEPLMQNLPPNVKVWGERTDIDHFMLASDVFMFNSTWECNPIVLREAIGYGLPIVARNLPQYAGMYDNYTYSIDADLELIAKYNNITYDIPKDNTTGIFAMAHQIAYEKILELPAQVQKVRILQNFINHPFLEIKGESDSDFDVRFYDENDVCQYQSTIKSNSWVRLNRQYYTKWKTYVYQDGELIYENILDLHGKIVFIAFESKSLGDTLAWIGYCEEFRKKYQCKVIVSTFWNKILDYPELELAEPGSSVSCYAMYRIGWFYDSNKEPVLCNTIPLQKAASNILGLDFEEVRPRLKYDIGNNKYGKYVTIATNSTSGLKFWLRSHWQEVIDFLVESGYNVINTSKERNPFNNCYQLEDTSIENTMSVIHHSEKFIGLSSGISWLAFGLGKKVIMIAGFTDINHEFECIRPYNTNVCHGCWNKPDIRFDAGDWAFCPNHKGTDRQFECQNNITPDMVIDEIKKAGSQPA